MLEAKLCEIMAYQILTSDWKGLKDHKQAILATSIMACQMITNNLRGLKDYKQAILATLIMEW